MQHHDEGLHMTTKARGTGPHGGSRKKPATDSLGRQTTGRGALARRIISIVGNTVGTVALVLGLGTVFWLLSLTARGKSISSAFPEDIGGTPTIAFPALMALVSMIALFFGQYAARGRWGTGKDSRFSSGSVTVLLRPISVGWHAALLALALVVWGLVALGPVVLDVQGRIAAEDYSEALGEMWFTANAYGALSGALAAMIGVSLVKKLTYNRSLQRHASSIQDGSPSQLRWRSVSHIWRTELGIAAVAGIALGLAPLIAHLGSLTEALPFVAVGVALLAGAIAMALNAWRSGLPVERVESYT
ncbi:hypothetical protein [Georgenia faecalis]|uniref:FtsX-like permease family protein n=1 Tax=Georgenia faecalis TaxID=2483799 RepID=A0ABV9D9F4_9MICO|nr:hypothetical protein [Georgenia faecalis]